MNAKAHPEPRTLAELDKIDPLSDAEEAALQAAIASDPDEAGAEWAHIGPHRELYPDGDDSPMRPAPELIARTRKNDPKFAKRLEDIARRAEDQRRARAAQSKPAAAE